MPLYQYRGKGTQGRPVSGRLEAVSVDTAVSQLERSGIVPLDVKRVDVTDDVTSLFKRFRLWSQVTANDLVMFGRQMYSLLKAGVPVNRAIRGLAEHANNPAFADVLQDVSFSLDAGQELSAAFAKHAKVFPEIFVSLVQVGEITGRLDAAFEQLSRYVLTDFETRKKIKGAFRYPMTVLAVMAAAIGIINFMVIPAFSGMFEQFGAELPLTTKILLGSSDFFLNYWPALLVGSVAGVGLIKYQLKTRTGRLVWDTWKLKLPLVGHIIHKAILARFARAFAMTSQAGVPLLQSLRVIAAASENMRIKAQIAAMREGIERGYSITQTAQDTRIFSPLILQMLAVGEESGELGSLMEEIADFYEREVEHELKGLSEAIEPILFLLLGGLVTVLALGVFLPMWDLGGLSAV